MERHRLPAVVPQPTMAEHLEILRLALRQHARVTNARRKACAFERLLWHAGDHLRRGDADKIEQRRNEVAGMAKLAAHLASRGNSFRPRHDKRIANAAAMGVLLVALE